MGPARHRLARPTVTCKRNAPTIASVTTAPRTSLAMRRGGLQGSPKLLTAASSLVHCRNCRRSHRAALPRDLTLRWIPRRRWQEPHPRTTARRWQRKTAARVTARGRRAIEGLHRPLTVVTARPTEIPEASVVASTTEAVVKAPPPRSRRGRWLAIVTVTGLAASSRAKGLGTQASTAYT